MTARQAMWQRMTLLGTLCCLAGSAPAASTPLSPAVPPPPLDAAVAGAGIPAVEVSGLDDPSERLYGRMLKGMELFERYAPRMPGITLRFRLLGFPTDALRKPLRLSLITEQSSVPLALADDFSFTLPQDAALAAAGARLRANRHAGSVLWFADVRSPGVAPDTRRLGDLRLECNIGVVGRVADFPSTPANLALAALDNPCGWRGTLFPFLAERAVFGVNLVNGARHQSLSSDMLYGAQLGTGPLARLLYSGRDWSHLRDRAYQLPLWDDSWPDDTVVTFEYMDDGPAPTASAAAASRAP
ncbi:hypothetical protein ACFOLJ_07710 [Rugamonas sp. CCM 8940]|uniref:hypothetical protein n=1 Tax=Rugamonas sp. CCM 8940 TaxID=2765359 RepID=UPI0018F2BFA2|nr:hypothetical protein [Rugamonas sp. CCM 8940]MBJ7310161.1 hypothetical protein [Rugamonas sp. CCM 8940]